MTLVDMVLYFAGGGAALIIAAVLLSPLIYVRLVVPGHCAVCGYNVTGSNPARSAPNVGLP